MVIELRDDKDIKPRKATTCKQIPTHWQEDADMMITKLVNDDIIERVPVDEVSDWISPAFFVPKPGGKAGLRLVTDFTQLSKYVKRPVHPFPSASDITKGIAAGAKFFCKLDAVQGYHQIALSEESRKLTTFLLPQGKFRYKRGPMGLTSTNDCWCYRSDAVIQGLPNCSKIVDDILITASNLSSLLQTIRTVLNRCRQAGLTISKKKFKIGTKISFAGYTLTSKGVHPDPAKVEAISKFPSPKDVTSVRSFLGLANQLGSFIPDLAMATNAIRGLLKKGIAFQWLPEHQAEMDFVKSLLTSPMLVHYYDPTLSTVLLTDASKLNGLGYALIQHDSEGKQRLIQAGSKSLTSAERNYAPIEQECLAAVWAIDKCRYFLLGCPNFQLITDHQPLVGIFKKELADIENRRLQRFRERVVDYSFQVEWVAGKTHLIADALSRHPIDTPDDRAFFVAAVLLHLDPQLDHLRESAKACPSYQRLLEAIKTMDTKTFQSLPKSDPLNGFSSIWDHLSVHEDGQIILYQADRILIPQPARPRILELLHQGHSGISKTRKLASQLYYWPGMSNEVKQMVSSCKACQEKLPLSSPLPLNQTTASFPMEKTSADLFSYGGNTYLAFADRFSGMVWADKLNSTTTTAVTNLLDKWMVDFGYTLTIRTDGGPQFRGPFDQWCEDNSIIHELSSPYHPESNGHAENAVKTTKTLLSKLDGNLRQFRRHLLAWRNTPRQDGYSPTDLFFGRRLRSALPSASLLPVRLDDAAASRMQQSSKTKARFDSHTRQLDPLLPGERVQVHGGDSATVIAESENGLSYTIQFDNGATTKRYRRYLHRQTDSQQTDGEECS